MRGAEGRYGRLDEMAAAVAVPGGTWRPLARERQHSLPAAGHAPHAAATQAVPLAPSSLLWALPLLVAPRPIAAHAAPLCSSAVATHTCAPAWAAGWQGL